MRFGEYLPDLPDRDNNGLTVAKNCIPHTVSYRQILSPVVYSSALDARCRGVISSQDTAGNTYNYAGDATKLYALGGVTYSDVSVAGGYSTATDDMWEFAKWGDKIIAVNGLTDSPQIITMGGANFANLGGSPPSARHVGVVRDFVVLGNITGSANELHWSAFNDGTGWTAGTDQSDTQELQSGGWIQRIVGGEYGTIFCERSIYRMTYVGYPLIFQLDEVESNRGTPAPGSVAKFGNSSFYLGWDGFYRFNGTQSVPIGANKVDKTFYGDFDGNFYTRITSAVDPINNLVFWSYPGIGNTGGRSNRILVYNWTTDRWAGPIELEHHFIAQTMAIGYTLDELTTSLGYTDIDNVPFSLDSRFWQGGNILLSVFDEDHKLNNFTGPAMTATLETGEYEMNPGGRSFITGVRPLYVGDGAATLALGTRSGVNDPVSWSASVSPNSQTGLCPFRVNARYHRARMTITGGFDHAFGVEAEGKQVGKK